MPRQARPKKKPDGRKAHRAFNIFGAVKGVELLLLCRMAACFQQFDLFFTPAFSPSPSVLFLQHTRSSVVRKIARAGHSDFKSDFPKPTAQPPAFCRCQGLLWLRRGRGLRNFGISNAEGCSQRFKVFSRHLAERVELAGLEYNRLEIESPPDAQKPAQGGLLMFSEYFQTLCSARPLRGS